MSACTFPGTQGNTTRTKVSGEVKEHINSSLMKIYGPICNEHPAGGLEQIALLLITGLVTCTDEHVTSNYYKSIAALTIIVHYITSYLMYSVIQLCLELNFPRPPGIYNSNMTNSKKFHGPAQYYWHQWRYDTFLCTTRVS